MFISSIRFSDFLVYFASYFNNEIYKIRIGENIRLFCHNELGIFYLIKNFQYFQQSPGKVVRIHSPQEPKYQSDFGQHLTYMYLLPEAEQTYLKQPIPPHPPQPAQFHTPQGYFPYLIFHIKSLF